MARHDALSYVRKGADVLPRAAQEAGGWGFDALTGRLGELSGRGAGAQISLALGLVAEAQHRGEPAAWITGPASTFYPPDAAAAGVALDRLPVVFAPDATAAARAADKLVRSGAFGLVVIDLAGRAAAGADRRGGPGAHAGYGACAAAIPMPLLSRLTGLAQEHATALLVLTDKPAEDPSLGSLVAVRCEATRQPAGTGTFLCVARALKDKRRGPGWSWAEVRRGPLGLR